MYSTVSCSFESIHQIYKEQLFILKNQNTPKAPPNCDKSHFDHYRLYLNGLNTREQLKSSTFHMLNTY